MKSNDWRHKNVARYTPGNTKILYFFNCLLDGMHTKEQGMVVFFHMDLVEGIGKDASGIHFAKETLGISGVQSTRVHILKLAKQEKLVTVHRLFVTDFQALQSGLKLVHTSNPDFVELTPGILHPIVKKVSKEIPYPVISSGLIAGKDEVEKLLEEGASNIVCSDQKLWSF